MGLSSMLFSYLHSVSIDARLRYRSRTQIEIAMGLI